MNKKIVILGIITVLVPFAIGLNVGIYRSQQIIRINKNQSDLAGIQVDRREPSISKRDLFGSKPSGVKSVERRITLNYLQNDKSPEEILNQLFEIDKNKSGYLGHLRCETQTYDLLKNLTEEELYQLLMSVKELGFKPPRSVSVVLELYAQKRPLLALDFFQDNKFAMQILEVSVSRILCDWSKHDPNAALSWYIGNSHDTEIDKWYGPNAMSNIFMNLSEISLQGALETYQQLEIGATEKQWAMEGILTTVSENSEFSTVLEPSSYLDHNMKSKLLSKWIKKEPGEAILWFEKLTHSEQNSLGKSMLKTWMEIDPSKAADWYSEKLEKSLFVDRQIAVDRTLGISKYGEPDDMLNWLDRQNGIDREKSLYKYFKQNINLIPEFVQQNLTRLGNEEMRNDLAIKVYETLQSKNPRKALEMLKDPIYSETLKKNTF